MAQVYLRGNVYWIRLTRDGREVNFSTRTRDEGQAKNFLADYIASLSRYVDPAWRREVLKDRGSRSGWQARVYRAMRERAAKRKRDCMSPDELYALLVESGGRCAITGLPLILSSPRPRDPFRASVDRIDPTLGYSKANSRIVALVVNVSMNAWGFAALEAISAAIISRKLAGHSAEHCMKTQQSYMSGEIGIST